MPQHFQLSVKSNVKLLLVLTIMFWLGADSSLQGDHKHGGVGVVEEGEKPIKSRDAKKLDAELVACDVIGHLTMIMALKRAVYYTARC